MPPIPPAANVTDVVIILYKKPSGEQIIVVGIDEKRDGLGAINAGYNYIKITITPNTNPVPPLMSKVIINEEFYSIKEVIRINSIRNRMKKMRILMRKRRNGNGNRNGK